MKPRKDICIAGARTIGEWEACKAALAVGGTSELWATAFRDFFLERLRTRYFAPIEILRKPGSPAFQVGSLRSNFPAMR